MLAAPENGLKIGIAGLGAIGGTLVERLVDGVGGLTLKAVSVGNADKARRRLERWTAPRRGN